MLHPPPVELEDLERSFEERLVLLLGEEDDGDETGGILLRSPAADAQGAHRLARGISFYQAGRTTAETMNADVRWTLRTVPGVGHDFRAMSAAAADHLYEAEAGGSSDE